MLFEEIFVKEAFLKPTELRTRATTFQQKFEDFEELLFFIKVD